jgi:hypothetical protein
MRAKWGLGSWATLLALVGTFGATFVLAFTGVTSSATASINSLRARTNDRYIPTMRALPGPELVLVFIGSSTCGPSNQRELPGQVEQLKLALQRRARTSGRSFTTLGIARDWDTDAGIRHLNRFGRFDEVIAGRNWLNTGLLRYVWEDIPGQAATPQLLVLERRLVDRRSNEAADGIVRDERLLVRKVGSAEIERWLAQSAPMPRLAAAAAVGRPEDAR